MRDHATATRRDERLARRPSAVIAACGLAACAAAVALLSAGSASAGGKAVEASSRMIIYSLSTQEEFNNHADDRVRGNAHNPLGNFSTNTSATKEGTSGPFAGDRAIFVFKLFSGANLKSTIGSATFSCQYAFAKHAICNAVYSLGGSSVLGIGFLDFNARKFALAVTGGTGKFRGKRGDIQATSAPNGANKLAFNFL